MAPDERESAATASHSPAKAAATFWLPEAAKVCVKVTVPLASVVPLSVPPSLYVTVTVLPARAGMPGPADVSVTTKLAGWVATTKVGVTVRLVAVASRPTPSVILAEDAE